MKTNYPKTLALSLFLCLHLIVTGCCIRIGDSNREKYKRTEQLSAPIKADGTLNVRTNVGSITVTGADVTDCNIIATITTKARTIEEAQKRSREVKIELDSSADTLYVRIEKPVELKNKWLKVDFKIIVPKQLNLDCSADVGKINISATAGRIEASTNVGKIICKEISGDIDLRADVGKIKAIYADTAPAALNANITIDVGTIYFVGPPELSVELDASIDVGSIKTGRPITLVGEISKKRLKGTIGTGQGQLRLKTDVGSITIK